MPNIITRLFRWHSKSNQNESGTTTSAAPSSSAHSPENGRHELDQPASVSKETQSAVRALEAHSRLISKVQASVGTLAHIAKKNSSIANQILARNQECSKNSNLGRESLEKISDSISQGLKHASIACNQLEENHRRMQEIVNFINHIESKTKVIHDIVFQTKILSFNASVEAARAGEHGKGFSVVAKEVGKLAEMSGTAAKEIAGILEAGTLKIQEMISKGNQEVEELVKKGRAHVHSGTEATSGLTQAIEQVVRSLEESLRLTQGLVGDADSQERILIQTSNEIEVFKSSSGSNVVTEPLSPASEKSMSVFTETEVPSEDDVRFKEV